MLCELAKLVLTPHTRTKRLFSNSYGTFGFWSAFLKMGGDVILAAEMTKNPTFLEAVVPTNLPNWIFLNDPCLFKNESGVVITKVGCA